MYEDHICTENKDYSKWKQNTAKVRTSFNLPGDSAPWTRRKQFTIAGCRPSERQRQIIDVAFSVRRNTMPESTTAEVAKGFWANVSQAIQRKPWATHLGSLTRGSVHYSFEHDLVLSGHLQLRAMGIPAHTAPTAEFSDRELRSLSGEMFSAPIVSLFTYAFYCCKDAPWWQRQ